jgi:NAD(P)-dependent dehydrogenase (short-subunit alcohol dehydrogenase family)
MTEPFFANPEFRAKTLARIPLGHLGTIEELMGAILFLASDASSLMTGTSLTIEAGPRFDPRSR